MAEVAVLAAVAMVAISLLALVDAQYLPPFPLQPPFILSSSEALMMSVPFMWISFSCYLYGLRSLMKRDNKEFLVEFSADI